MFQSTSQKIGGYIPLLKKTLNDVSGSNVITENKAKNCLEQSMTTVYIVKSVDF